MEQDTNKSLEIKNQISNQSESHFYNAKSQKLATAIYLITGFFSDNEPLKWKLRDLSSKLISVSLSIKDNHSRHNNSAVEAQSIILETISLLLVLKQAGLISEMNHSIINQEFTSLLASILPSDEFESVKGMNMKKEFFDIPEIKHKALQRSIATTPVSKTVIKDKNTEDLKDFSVVAVKKNSRQSIIINLLKRKKEIMIKDVSPLIDGCSEKTIQRELMSMVHSGILNKIGEKRWSRYSLARP